MTAAQVVDTVMCAEHADLLRESVAWVVAELMEADVAAQIGAAHGEARPSGPATDWRCLSSRRREQPSPHRRS